MRKKLIAGAAVLALLMNSPQVSAEDEDVVIFGGEFDDEAKKPKEVERPAPIRELPPPPVEKPPVEKPAPVVEKVKPKPEPEPVNEPEPVDKPFSKPEPVNEPIKEPVNEPTLNPVQNSDELPEDDDDLGDVLIFDDLSRTDREPVEQPIDEPEPVNEPIDKPEPINNPTPEPIDEPQPEVNEPVIIVPPADESDKPSKKSEREERSRREVASNKNLKELKQRFIKLAVDETYTYYLDKTSVQWKKMPYSTSEYIADIWVRLIEREPQRFDDDMDYYVADNSNAEISLAQEKGYRYCEQDLQVLRHQSYVLEHYYLRTKKKQIQFLCELEVFGRPQNTINERDYDYRNWEELVPGSVESVIYNSVIQLIDMSKADPKGHMTFSDMLDEYLRISL